MRSRLSKYVAVSSTCEYFSEDNISYVTKFLSRSHLGFKLSTDYTRYNGHAEI